MADVRTNALPDTEALPESPPSQTHVSIRREDYHSPDWLVPKIGLDFSLDAERTSVRATLGVKRNGAHDRPLRLDGHELKLLWVKVDGTDAKWRLEGEQLIIDVPGDEAV